MKKAILGLLSVGAAASALAQGTVVFESATSTGAITMDSSSGAYAAAGTYTVALLWAPGSSLNTAQANFTQVATFGPAGTSTGYITDGAVISVAGLAGGTVGVFEVQGWTGSYANYAAALAAGAAAKEGQTAAFFNSSGNPNPPATPPVNTTGWDGNLILVGSVPEPGTLALGGLGAAALLFFRRRK